MKAQNTCAKQAVTTAKQNETINPARDVREVSLAIAPSGSPKADHAPLRFADLFCGIGGFHIALKSLGHRCVFSSEIDPKAAESYEANFGARPSGDITKISAEDIPVHDILCAGFPCQSYSTAGLRLGDGDERGKLPEHIFRIAEAKRPRALILENVPALQTTDGGRTFKEILARLDTLGYDAHAEVLNAAMFGVPQARKRLFIVATLRKAGVSYTPPVPEAEQVSLSSILDENSDGAVVRREDFVLREAKTTKPHAPIPCGLVGPKGRQGYRIYSPAGPACTLTASGGGPGGQTGLYLIDGKLRRLSQTEAKRAMGFPDSHIVTPGRAGVKQLGNSVCPPVVAAIAAGLRFAAPEAVARPKLTLPQDGTSGSDEYSTPSWLAKFTAEYFNSELDPATSLGNPNNVLFRTVYCLERGEDGLALPWLGRIFCNPPYSALLAWTSKAVAEILNGNAEIVVMVLPCRLGNDWFFKNIYHCDFCQWFPLRDRVAFGGRGGGGDFDTIVAVWRRPGTPPVVDERALSLAIGEARAEHYAQRAAARKAESERKRTVRLMEKEEAKRLAKAKKDAARLAAKA